MEPNTINSFLAEGFSNLKDTDLLTEMNFLEQRGFKLVSILGCGSFGVVILAE